VKIECSAFGPPELVREDGWRYRLEGVLGLDWELDYDDDRYVWEIAKRLPGRPVVTVTIAVLSDATLNSIRVLRDELTECSIRLNHDY
jgi:hypothetical protein